MKGPIIILAIILLLIIYSVFKIIKGGQCPYCRKIFSLKLEHKDLINKTPASMDIKREKRDKAGKVINTYTETVPATRYEYVCRYKCKSCGQTINKKITETKRN